MSAIGVSGRSFLEVVLNERVVPLEVLSFGSLLISEHQLYHLPCGQLSFTDALKVMTKVATPADGSEVIIRVGRTQDNAETYKFRLVSLKSRPDGNNVRYTMSLILDSLSWWGNTTLPSIKGPSSLAMLQLAAASGLGYEGDDTNDSQVWLPYGEAACKFARRISKTGYRGPTSCMLMGVGLDKKLRYRDLAARDFKGKLPLLSYGVEAGMVCTSWRMQSLSGVQNLLGGYNATLDQYSPEKASQTSESIVSARKISPILNVNKSLKTSVGAGRTQVLPLNSGNKHANAVKAQSQNERISALLSQSVAAVTPFKTGLSLFDPVYFQNMNLNDKGAFEEDKMSSGPYLVAGRAVYLTKDLQYCERLQLIRDGIGTDKSRVT